MTTTAPAHHAPNAVRGPFTSWLPGLLEGCIERAHRWSASRRRAAELIAEMT